MLGYGCEPHKEGDVELRRFVLTGSDKKPDYECQVAGIGCQKNSDCHYKAHLTSLSGCHCYGSSCIDEELVERNGETKKQRQIRWTRKHGSSIHEGVNKSCKWSVKGCKCRPGLLSPDWVTVWPKHKDQEEEEGKEEEESGDSLTEGGTPGDDGDPLAAL